MTPELWQRVDEIFAATEGLTREQVSVYLDRECNGNTALRLEVEALLEFDQPKDGLLQVMVDQAAEVFANSQSHPRPDPAENRIGSRIGHYRLSQVIGTGGMGVVYLANRDDEQYQKKVALKLVQQGHDTKFVLDRFRQERQILAQLEHPNIARFIDGGITLEGLPYYVMEFVEDGEPVVDYCRKRNLSVLQRLNLFLHVCNAVNYAHRNLVVHRDLKPSNILVDANGTPKLLDFGIAKVLTSDPSAGGNTQTAVRMLTPDYASPEQVIGSAITTATDVYSLGAILYEMLSDQLAHRFQNYSSTEIHRVVCTRDPIAPSQAVLLGDKTPERLRRAKLIQGDLDSIVAKAMRKEPDRRYQSVGALIDDVDRYASGQPVLAHRGTIRYRTTKFIRRHKLTFAASAMVLLTLIGGIGATAYQARRAERRFQQVRSLANTLLNEFDKRIATLPQSTELREWMSATVVRYLDNLSTDAGGDDSLRRELAQGYIQVGLLQGAPTSANLGQNSAALASYGKAFEILTQVAARNPKDASVLVPLCSTERLLGSAELFAGNIAKSRQYFQQGVRHGSALVEVNQAMGHECLAGSYSGLVQSEINSSNARGAAPYIANAIEHAKAYAKLVPGSNAQERIISGLIALSAAREESGDPIGAMKAAEEAMSMGEKQLGPQKWSESRLKYKLHDTMGDIAANPRDIHLGLRDAAIAHYRSALAYNEQQAARDTSDARARREVDRCLRRLALLLVDDQPEQAMQMCQRALKISELHLRTSPTNPEYMRDRADGWLITGYGLQNLNRLDEAMVYFQKALQLQWDMQRVSPESRRFKREIQETCEAIGALYRQLGKGKEALASFEKGMEVTVGLLWARPTDPYLLRDLADSHESLAIYHSWMARKGGLQARTHWKQAIDFQKKSLLNWLEWPRRVAPSPYQQRREEKARKALELYEKAAAAAR